MAQRQAGTTREQRWVLGLSSLASFIVILDAVVIATALTALRHGLGASLADLEWTVNAYTLSFAVLLMTAAAFGDRFGRRRVFAAGLALFAASSVVCALAPNAAVLIAARSVQGAGSAAIMPTALALLNAAFPPARRGWAIGIYGGVTALAAVAGPVLGGAITQGLGWQWIFWCNVPIALVAIPLVLTRIPEAARPSRATVDLPGLLLVTAAALGLVWGLVRGNTTGWGSAEVLSALAVGAVAAVAFAAWERRAAHPMIPARLFRSPAFSSGNAAIFAVNASLRGVIFLMPQFQQVVDGQDPLGAGLRLLPWGIAPFLIGPRAGALADRIGERTLVVAGSLLQAAGVAWIAAVAGPGSYLALVVPMTMIGAGFALAIPAVTRSVTSSVPPGDIGTASGAFAAMRQLGGAFGVAILGAAFAGAGSYATPADFSRGFTAAFYVAAGLAFAGAVAGTILPRLRDRRSPAPAPELAAPSGTPEVPAGVTVRGPGAGLGRSRP